MFKFVMTKNSSEIFHRAILSNDVGRTKLILDEAMKDPRFNIDDINDEGLTALQFSCFAGNLETVKILIAHKASYKIRDRDGNTLLHASALASTTEVMKYLIRVGLKPTVRNDDNLMPIDITDDISVIVILLRAMLDKGYLEEMQEYMLDHPTLKRNIFKELERVKCREQEKKEILKDLPYSSHTSPRRQANRSVEQVKADYKSRSLSTFSKLSDSILSLDQMTLHVDRYNSRNHRHSVDYSQTRVVPDVPTLKRNNSSSSTSSHGSRSSRGSGGILRNNDLSEYDALHRSTQQYLESRFPCSSNTKSVSFELDHPSSKHRNNSEGYVSDSYDDKLSVNGIRPLSRSSSISSHSSSQVFSDTCSNFDFPPRSEEEYLYANTQTLKPKNLPTIDENLYENLPLNRNTPTPPPIPPRVPQHQHDTRRIIDSRNSSFESNSGVDTNYPPYSTNDRQFGSETDSGIDINETAGRVFALSLDDQNPTEQYSTFSQTQNNSSSYSKPIGIFYSQQMAPPSIARRDYEVDNSASFIRPTANGMNPKYRSWNGRTLLQQNQQLEQQGNSSPYASHNRRRQNQSRDDFDVYDNRNKHDVDDPYNYQRPQQNECYGVRESDVRSLNFDHQPEIML